MRAYRIRWKEQDADWKGTHEYERPEVRRSLLVVTDSPSRAIGLWDTNYQCRPGWRVVDEVSVSANGVGPVILDADLPGGMFGE